VLPVPTRSFGGIGVFAIPEMGRFYRHVLIQGGFPHHGAVAFGHYGKQLFEVFKYLGVPVEEIGYNQPAGVRYPTENPWKWCKGTIIYTGTWEIGLFCSSQNIEKIKNPSGKTYLGSMERGFVRVKKHEQYKSEQ